MDSSVDTRPSSVDICRRLSRAAYARHAGVSRSTVKRWIDAGRITVGDDGRIDPVTADEEREATESPLPKHQARKAQIEAEKALRDQIIADGAALDDLKQISINLKRATYELQAAKAEAARLDLDQRAGALVERTEVDYVLQDLARHLQSRLANMAGLLAPTLARHRGDVAALHTELAAFGRDLLDDLAQRMREQAARRFGG